MKGLPAALVRRIVRAVLAGERKTGLISVTFLGPRAMRTLNRRHKRHDEPTDVLSFPLPQPGRAVAGDIYICPAVARAQAKRLDIPVRQELARLVVHGTLHALGYDHPAGKHREMSAMWRRQEGYLRRIFPGAA